MLAKKPQIIKIDIFCHSNNNNFVYVTLNMDVNVGTNVDENMDAYMDSTTQKLNFKHFLKAKNIKIKFDDLIKYKNMWDNYPMEIKKIILFGDDDDENPWEIDDMDYFDWDGMDENIRNAIIKSGKVSYILYAFGEMTDYSFDFHKLHKTKLDGFAENVEEVLDNLMEQYGIVDGDDKFSPDDLNDGYSMSYFHLNQLVFYEKPGWDKKIYYGGPPVFTPIPMKAFKYWKQFILDEESNEWEILTWLEENVNNNSNPDHGWPSNRVYG